MWGWGLNQKQHIIKGMTCRMGHYLVIYCMHQIDLKKIEIYVKIYFATTVNGA